MLSDKRIANRNLFRSLNSGRSLPENTMIGHGGNLMSVFVAFSAAFLLPFTFGRECAPGKDCVDGNIADEDHVLLAVAGYNNDVINVVDLNNPDSNCESIDIGPLTSVSTPQTMHASYLNEKLLVCAYQSYDCYYYNDQLGIWTSGPERIEPRFFPYALDVNSTVHWVTGGDLSDTEIYDGSGFRQGVNLPLSVRCHCLVPLGNGDMLLVGGYDNYNAYIINIDSEDFLTLDFPVSDELVLPACGLATRADGSSVAVIAGGEGPCCGENASADTYIYDISLGIFLPGPDLPEPRACGRAVQYQNSFVIVGGAGVRDCTAGFREDILFYDPDAEDWVTLPQKISTPDWVTAAVLVSDDFKVNCS